MLNRALLLALSVTMLVLAFVAGALQAEVVQLQHRPASVVIEQVPAPAPPPAVAASSCPGAASCLTVPYVDYGMRGAGLQVTGAAGFGGKAVLFNDYKGAPEGWFSNGGWYVAVAKHELGPGYCLVNVRTRHWRTRCLSWRALSWLLAQSRGR